VFGALSERQGQLRSLIRNANTVFATTARRNRDLQAAFVALPTFERESQATLRRLAQFAVDTNPLVTQLRPAARELSPTLQDLSLLAPDLKALFIELNPLIDASKAGFPAAQRILRDLRPLLAQVDPAAQQLVPLLDFLGLYKRELTAFFANTVASTQAKSTSTQVHYLRTTNPFNPENLAVYPRRLGTNRPNAYMQPNGSDKLPTGMEVFEDRHCGRALPVATNEGTPTVTVTPPSTPSLPGLPVPVPTVPPTPPISTGEAQKLIPQELLDRINKFAFANAPAGTAPAPPCKRQAPFTFEGVTSQYPHVRAASGG
jgi:phospholipid/cholesterol/gamma-HCH transport system substrate-binding protein